MTAGERKPVPGDRDGRDKATGPASWASSPDHIHPSLFPSTSGPAPRGPVLAPCGFGCVCSHSPLSRRGLSPAESSRDSAPGLRGSLDTGEPGPCSPPFPLRTAAAQTRPQHPCRLEPRPGWGECSEQRYRHYTRGRSCHRIWHLSLEETKGPWPPLGSCCAGTFQEPGAPQSPRTAPARPGLPRPPFPPCLALRGLDSQVCGLIVSAPLPWAPPHPQP